MKKLADGFGEEEPVGGAEQSSAIRTDGFGEEEPVMAIADDGFGEEEPIDDGFGKEEPVGGAPEKKSLGILGTLGAQTDAKAGREVGTVESFAENLPVVGQVMDAEYNRQWNNLRRLYEGDFNNAIEATSLALNLGFSKEDTDRINEEAGYGGRNLLGNYTQFDMEKGKALFKELVAPEFAKRLQARQAAEEKLANNDLNWAQKGVVGGVGATKMIGSMASGPLAAATLSVDAMNRAAGMVEGRYTLDENGDPTKIWWKIDANGNPVRDEAGNLVPREEVNGDMAMLKGFAGAGAERFIWMGLGKLTRIGFGKAVGAAEKTAVGAKVSEMLAKATSGTMKGVKEATEWLGKTSTGRAVLSVGKVLGWLNEKGKFGSIPDMMVKSRIQEFADEVVGLSVADPDEREEFTKWLGKFVSVKENAELFTEMLAMHLAMKVGGKTLKLAGKGLEKIGLNEGAAERSSAIKSAREGVAELIGEERAKKLTDKDLINLYGFVTSKGFTAERAEQFAEKIAGDVDAAQKLIDEGASLSSLAEGLKTRRQYSDEFVAGAKAAAAELRDRVTLDDVQSGKVNNAALNAAEGNVEIAAKVAALAKARLTNKHTQVDDADGLEALVAEAMRPFEPEARAVKIHDLKGNRDVGAQLTALEELGIASVEDAELNGVVKRDESGRLTGDARQAVNIAAHGTEALKGAVKDGAIDAATAEALITVSHTELGAEAPEARRAFIDGILERAKGDAALARRMVELAGEGLTQSSQSPQSGNEKSGIGNEKPKVESRPNAVGRAEVSPRPDKVSVREKIKNFIKGLLPRKDGTVIKYKESDTDTRRLTEEATKAYNAYASKEYKLPTGGVLYFAPDARTVEAYGGDVGAAWGEYALHLVTHRRGNGDNLYRSFDGSSVDKVLPNIEEIIAANQVKVSDGRIVFFMQTVDGGSKNKSRYACLVTEPDANGNLRVDLRYVTGMQERGFLPGETVTLEEAIRNRTAEGRALHPDRPTTGSRSNTASAQSPESGNSVPNNSPRVNGVELDALAERAKVSLALEESRPAGLEEISGCKLTSIEGGVMGCSRFRSMTAQLTDGKLVVRGLGEGQVAKPGNWADGAVLVAELQRIADRNGAVLDFGSVEAATEAAGLLNKVKAEGLERAKARLETRAKLFDILSRSALDTGVTFDEASFRKALEESPNGRKYRDNHGSIYGFASPDGTLHFNPTQLDYNIPIHEYGHLALESMKGVNRRLWERGMELVKGSDYYRDIKEMSETEGHEYSYLKGDEAGICDEALATLIGDRGEKLVEEQGVGAELKAWLKDFWKAFKGAFGLADMSDAQIEKLTLGEFVDAVNAELLRGKEFGTRKATPLKEKSIKRYDEADGSGSNGMLRWKNDRGRLFYIPVDMERTQPGGKVVLATDDANITDWIQQRLNGVELRMSKTGNIYVKGRDGLEGELAEVFGRYPKAGQNDGIFEQLASELQNESLREATPDQLVEMLAKDRANYDEWVKATRDGKRSLEDAKLEQHYAEEAEREEYEARQRWESSGMDLPEYILSRIEEGEPGFDLDWETMREMARDEAEARFAAGETLARFAVGKVRAAGVSDATKKEFADDPATAKWEIKTEPSVVRQLEPERLVAANPVTEATDNNSVRKAVERQFKQFGKVRNLADSEEVVFNPGDAGKIMMQSGADMRVFAPQLRHLFETSIPMIDGPQEAFPGHKFRTNVNWFKNYVNKFTDADDREKYIRFTVRIENNWQKKGVHAATVSEVAIYEDANAAKTVLGTNPGESAASSNVSTGSSVRANKLRGRSRVFTDRILSKFLEKGKGGAAKFAVGGRVAASNMGIKGAAEAEAMEKTGADREKIWRETGWWKGKDGKWRFELPRMRRGAWHGDPEERHFTGGGDDFYRYRLTELVKNDDFFKAYPQAKKITVEFHKGMPTNVGGNFNEATLTIKLPQKYQVITDYVKYGLGEGKAAGLNAAGAKTIEHELQHAVQLFESFAKGGSPSDPVRPYALDGNTGHALSVFAEAYGMDVTNDRHLAIIASNAQKIASDQTRGEMPKRLVEAFEAAAKEAGKTPAEFSDEINRLYDSHTDSPMGQYFKLAGEVEARNAQFRANMTPEERAATPPWETEDVPESRQIVRFAVAKSVTGPDGSETYKVENNGKTKRYKTPKEALEDFIKELDGLTLNEEQQGIYDVVTGVKNTADIRKNDLGELVKFHKGGRGKGAGKIIAVHYAGKRGRVTAKEVIDIGQVIRSGTLDYDGNAEHPYSHTYTATAVDGAELKVVIDLDKKGNEAVINFYSDRKTGNGGQRPHPVSTTTSSSPQSIPNSAAGAQGGAAKLAAGKRTVGYTAPDGSAKPGYLKAPNGNDSRLDERQWNEVRTESYGKWFGDWQSKIRRDKLDAIKPMKVRVGAISARDGLSAAAAAKRWFAKNVGSAEYNTEVGKVVIDGRSIHDSLAHKYSQAKLDAVTTLKDGFATAVYIGSGKDIDGKPLMNHYFAYPIQYGSERRIVFCRAREDAQKNRLYLHEVFVEKNLSDSLQTAALPEGRTLRGGIALMKSILNRIYAVKGEDVSKIVDENGEPLVVYRGAEYDPLVQEVGKGVIMPEAYFTADPEYAKRYTGNGGKVRAYYLNIRRPFDIRDPECLKDLQKIYPDHEFQRGKSGALDWGEASIVDGEFIKENFGDKYDGIIYDEGGDPTDGGPTHRGISYVPLDGGVQVKSATNNIGTFDPGNPDVRFAAGGQVVGDYIIGPDGTLARRGTPQAAMIGGARVADDAGYGERTPGTLAASRELSEQPRSRIQEIGRVRVASFPISEIFRMHKDLSGNPMPVHVSKRVRGGKVSASSKDGQIYIASDVIGLVDRTDIPPLKEKLAQHGFFRHENEAWAKNHSPAEVRQERERSEQQLGDELRKLAGLRASGKEPGGQSAERLVYMNEFAKYVMNMPRKKGSLVGDVQTVGDAVRGAMNTLLAASGDKRSEREKKMRAEAKGLLTWSGWRVEDATEADIKDLTDTMFGAWLAIPEEMERVAPTWYDAILSTITTTPSAAKAYRAAAERTVSSPHAYKSVLEEIQKSQSAAVQAIRDKLDAEAKAPITARSLLRRFAEGLVLGYHDRMGLTWMRFDEETKEKLKARRNALAELKRKGATKAELKAAAEEIDLFTGRIYQTKQKLELSRSAMERGIQNEGVRYVILNRLLEDKATKKWGLSEADKSLYLDQLWVIDSQGRSGIRGESARQARLILGDMARRLGSEKWARMEEYGREWFSIRERELLNDPRLERLVGKDVVAYWRSNAHYVTTKRVQSPEEMEAIERTREKMRKADMNGGDDVCGEMFSYIGDRGGREHLGEKLWKGRLSGSFADKAEVRGATTEKDMKIQQAARVNQYVVDLRDALLMAEVPGVRDMPYGKADVKEGSRYGFINYFDYGEKRTLIVPREIADGFRRDPETFQWTAQMHRVARGMMIDYNLGYLPVNQMRNAGSIEKNMPGVYESWAKTLAGFTGIPGAAPLVDLFLEHAARKSAKTDRMLGKVFFGITRFGHINPAERAAKFIFDPEGWQKKFWDAEARGDEDAMRGLIEDKDFAMSALRANMFTTLGGAYGDAVRDERLLSIGKKIGAAIDRTPVARTLKKGADWLPRQNEFEDVFAKLVAFHHDRATFGKAHNRTVEESGLVVKQNVSIGEGERRGRNTNAIQTFFGQFFNMREKGVVRHVKAYFDRPKEMSVKAGMVWGRRCVGTMFATGAIAAFIRWLYGDDDKKAEESPLGGTYRFAKFMQAASQNINDYARKRHQLVPVWLSPDGYTTITLGAALNDEDSLIAPSADFVARAISARMGLNPPPELGQTVLDTVWRGIAPDLDPSTPIVKTLRDTIYALADNPMDDFTGKPVYDPVLYAVRNESWAARVDFATEMAKRVWDDWGASAIWKFDRYGKESSDYGSASKWLGLALNDIPVVSSATRRFVKIHVREPGRGSGVDAAVSAEDRRRANVRQYLSDDLLKRSEKMGGAMNRMDPKQYGELLADWQGTYGLSLYDMRLIEKRFLNKWSDRENREWVRNKKRNQLLRKAQRMGIEESERRMIRGDR